jgi:hypothetical protein
MSEPSFLTVEQVEWLHKVAIGRFGGTQGESLDKGLSPKFKLSCSKVVNCRRRTGKLDLR